LLLKFADTLFIAFVIAYAFGVPNSGEMFDVLLRFLALSIRTIFGLQTQSRAIVKGAFSGIDAPIPHSVDENESASLLRVRRQIFIGG
jgi:hypothetical protein